MPRNPNRLTNYLGFIADPAWVAPDKRWSRTRTVLTIIALIAFFLIGLLK